MKSSLRLTYELLQPFVKKRMGVLVLVLVLGALTAAFQASVLMFVGPVHRIVLFPSAEEGGGLGGSDRVDAWFLDVGAWLVERGLIESTRFGVLWAVVLVALLFATLGALTQYSYTVLARRIGFATIIDLRLALARHLTGLSIRYHGQRKFGDLLSRISADVAQTLQAINVGLKILVLEPLLALGCLGIAAYVAPIPTLGILGLILLAVVPISRLSRKVKKGSRRSLTQLGASVQALSQMFLGIRTVKAFGGEERELARYKALNEEYLKSSMKMVRAIATAHAWSVFFTTAGIAVLLVLATWLTLAYAMFKDAGQLASFFLAVAMLTNHVKTFSKSMSAVQESVGASERIMALFDEPSDVVERPNALAVHAVQGGIRFENVSFRYPASDALALRGVTLHVRPGETLALVGPSGAGKSTFVDLVARFIDPTEGRISVDGHDLRDLRKADWTALYAMVGQVPFLFHASLADNIRYGKPDATDEEVVHAARTANIHEFIAALPQGYATDAADMGSRLSGGQRQRITIARAILKSAPILLLDEATSALDSESELEVQRALERLMSHRTVIVIAHRLSTIQKADRIAVLEGGALVELGTHAELISRGGTYARLYALQKLGIEGDADALEASEAPSR